jgi:hypothetical protein
LQFLFLFFFGSSDKLGTESFRQPTTRPPKRKTRENMGTFDSKFAFAFISGLWGMSELREVEDMPADFDPNLWHMRKGVSVETDRILSAVP